MSKYGFFSGPYFPAFGLNTGKYGLEKISSLNTTQCTVEVKSLRTLGLEVFTTLNNLNPAFKEEIFHRTKWLTHMNNNIKAIVYKKAKYGDKSLRTFGPHIWIKLPDHMKAETNFINFR